MQSTTYGDLIEEKGMEWKNKLVELEERALKAGPDEVGKLADLRSGIAAALQELKTLDRQETVENTVEIKDKIVAIFHTIDESFTAFKEKTPFML